MSCDLSATPVKVWAPKQKGGGVLVGLETGRSYYFIDPVGDHCNTGKKVMVSDSYCIISVCLNYVFSVVGHCWYCNGD